MELVKIYMRILNFLWYVKRVRQLLKPNAYKAKVRELEELEQQLQRVKETKEEHEKTEEKQEYNFREMQKYITSLEELTTEQKKELHRLNTQVRKNEIDLKTLESTVEALKSKNEALNEEIVKQDEIINSTPNESALEREMQHFVEEELQVQLMHDKERKQFSIRGIVAYLIKKVQKLTIQVFGLESENRKLRAENDELRRVSSNIGQPKEDIRSDDDWKSKLNEIPDEIEDEKSQSTRHIMQNK